MAATALHRAALRTLIQGKGYPSDATAVAAQNSALEAAFRRVQGLRHWRWQRGTTTSTATIGNGTVSIGVSTGEIRGIDSIRVAFGTDYDLLEFKPWEELRDLDHQDRETRTPLYWTLPPEAGLPASNATELRDTAVQMWPRPDKAYTVTADYRFTPIWPNDDTTAIPFPPEHADALVWAAVSDLAYRQRDWNAATYADQQYQLRVAEMVKAHGIEQRDGPREVGRWEGWSQAEVG